MRHAKHLLIIIPFIALCAVILKLETKAEKDYIIEDLRLRNELLYNQRDSLIKAVELCGYEFQLKTRDFRTESELRQIISKRYDLQAYFMESEEN